MRTNKKATPVSLVETHEGGKALKGTAEQELRRAVLACLLFEDTFYENGEDIASRIQALVPLVAPTKVGQIAAEARGSGRIRHAPLLLARELLRHPTATNAHKRAAIAGVVQRADEAAEFLALYWKEGRKMVPKAARLGLADALNKFDAYQLAKYNRNNAVKLRDVLRMVHPKPKDQKQSALYKQILDDTLPSPDTWEVALSSGEDKAETFTRLINTNKLGYMALLRNLRNMEQSGVDKKLILDAIVRGAEQSKALPFRFITAFDHAPWAHDALNDAMLLACKTMDKLTGKTLLLVDTSGSMQAPLSDKGEIRRWDAAAALAALAREVCEEVDIWTFTQTASKVKPFRGLALIEAIKGADSGGTYLAASLAVASKGKTYYYDRIIVITDEQSADSIMAPSIYGANKGYIVNVAPYQNSIAYGPWVKIEGFSEQTIKFISEYEGVNNEDRQAA